MIRPISIDQSKDKRSRPVVTSLRVTNVAAFPQIRISVGCLPYRCFYITQDEYYKCSHCINNSGQIVPEDWLFEQGYSILHMKVKLFRFSVPCYNPSCFRLIPIILSLQMNFNCNIAGLGALNSWVDPQNLERSETDEGKTDREFHILRDRPHCCCSPCPLSSVTRGRGVKHPDTFIRSFSRSNQGQ